ncbi:hypothetical protein MASR1M31_19490 [Porphyromonadaceae bacterium]
MTSYKDIDNDSGVAAYKYGDDFIRVRFKSGDTYLYTYESAGVKNVESMKILAKEGDGLNAFINTYVRKLYASKER